MQIVLLSITEDLRKKIKLNSILNHFQECDLFYFSIPTNLYAADKNHLIEQSALFFKSQFMENIENSVSVENKREVRKKLQVAKELSWEIFYRFNQWIKVCEGVFDEDLDWFISGFTGKIIDFYADEGKSIFLIAFSGNSLSKLPLNHLITISRDTSPFYTFLESELIMPDFGPENMGVDEKKKTGILLQLTNLNNGQHEKFEDFSEILRDWVDQFRSNLAESEQVVLNLSQQTDAFLEEIPYFCDRFGLWGTFSIGDEKMDLSLTEIEKFSNNYNLNNLYQNYQKTMSLLLPN